MELYRLFASSLMAERGMEREASNLIASVYEKRGVRADREPSHAALASELGSSVASLLRYRQSVIPGLRRIFYRPTRFVTLSTAADYNFLRDLGMKASVRMVSIAVLVLLSILPSLAKKKQPAEPLATLNFVVLKDENGKPVRNAAVVMHPVDDEGKQERGGIELKTDPEGKTSYEGVPYGKLRVQVLAPGFQTYGEDFEVGQPSVDITIKLKRPAKQYSIYEDHPATPNPNGQPDKNPPQENLPPKP